MNLILMIGSEKLMFDIGPLGAEREPSDFGSEKLERYEIGEIMQKEYFVAFVSSYSYTRGRITTHVGLDYGNSIIVTKSISDSEIIKEIEETIGWEIRAKYNHYSHFNLKKVVILTWRRLEDPE